MCVSVSAHIMCTRECFCATCARRSEEYCQELVLFFHRRPHGPVIRFGGRHLYPLSHLIVSDTGLV